jgi:tRNA1Val (adenine37-N6)-methyltransferase
MSHNKYFQFKQFRIEQQHAAMKVNTDGVLLGAWANIDGVDSVLDVGTGTGLIALMIAQRNINSIITGIDIDGQAVVDATENVRKSPWPDRISIQHISFQNFAETNSGKFSLIISNPPFFSNSVKNTNTRLSLARHNHLLPFADIISGTLSLLDKSGRLSLILPVDEADLFIETASNNGLFLQRIANVKPFPDKEPNRSLIEFSFLKGETERTVFSLYDETKVNYSLEFIRLARDFYLKL